MKQRKFVTLVILGLVFMATIVSANDTVLYVSTFGTSYRVAGQEKTLSGLFSRTVPADTTWQFSGRPNNIVYSFDIYEPSHGQVLALATYTGIHQSWDGGKTWKETSDWRMTEITAVRFHPTNEKVIYASSPYGFYKSINGGHHWNQKNNGLTTTDETYVASFIIDATNSDQIWLVTKGGLFMSFDAGESWKKNDLKITDLWSLIQNPVNPEIFVVTTESNGLYFSLNGGKTWEERENGIVNNTFYTAAFDPQHPDTIYAGGFLTGVYKTTDGGTSWTSSFRGLETTNIYALAVDPLDSNRIYAGTQGGGVFISKDAGQSWTFMGIESGRISAIKALNFEEVK